MFRCCICRSVMTIINFLHSILIQESYCKYKYKLYQPIWNRNFALYATYAHYMARLLFHHKWKNSYNITNFLIKLDNLSLNLLSISTFSQSNLRKIICKHYFYIYINIGINKFSSIRNTSIIDQNINFSMNFNYFSHFSL